MFRPTNPPIHPPTHPPKKTPIHGWGILHRFQIFKRNWNISIHSSLIAFLLIWGIPPWGVGRWGWGWVGAPSMHMHMYMCMHACTHMCAHTFMHVKHDKHGCLHGGGHLQFPNMFILAFRACACVHVHVHMSRDTLHAPRCPPTHLPPPQSRREPKSPKVYKSWTNWDNSILFEKSLPLNIPELI